LCVKIINTINKYVQQEDTLYFVGDWCFGGIENIYNCYSRIICKNIIFIAGNHDDHIKKNKVLPNSPNLIKAQELFLETHMLLELYVEKIKVTLCHYPIEEWDDRYDKSVMLHGHQHGRNTDNPQRLDVGIDVAYKLFGEYRPFEWSEIKKLLL
jgi:calcineurin-like phosphoesterase family protein